MASGDVIALVNNMNQILVELVKLANLIVQVSKALACAGRVQAVLDLSLIHILNLFLRLFLRSPFVVVGAMVMAFTVNVRADWIFVVAIRCV